MHRAKTMAGESPPTQTTTTSAMVGRQSHVSQSLTLALRLWLWRFLLTDTQTTVVSTYFHLSGEPIAWTKEVVPGLVLLDVDANGKAIGIETLDGPLDLTDALSIISAAHFSTED